MVCSQVFSDQLSSHTGNAPIPFRKIGRWWRNNPKERREEEIDFIAFSDDKAAFGECKWKNTKVVSAGIIVTRAEKLNEIFRTVYDLDPKDKQWKLIRAY